MEKIKNYFIKNTKQLIFIIIFTLVCFVYNFNEQTLNYILKRGTVLEYSIPEKVTVDIFKLKNKLGNKDIKFSYIDIVDKTDEFVYDSDDKLIDKVLYIAIPILAKEDKISLFNSVSDFVFDEYKNSKLINIKTLNDIYSTPYSAFLKFLGVLFVSLFIWIVVLYLIYDSKALTKSAIASIKGFFVKQKEGFINLINKTKEKGVFYLLKRILFDENDEDKETNFTREIISTILFVVVCVIIIRYFIGELRWIPSGSMRPTILEKDRVFVEKLDYPKKEIKRGDILVFYPPSTNLSNSPLAIFSRLSGIFCKDMAFIKRAIGLPGEKFEVKYDNINNEFRVYINDKALNEPYISSRYDWTFCSENMYCGPFIIPKGHYFMMGDNRGNSQDSRFWGFLDENRIIGRANFMFFPIARINLLRDKYLYLHEQKIGNETKEKDYIINRYEFLYKI